MHIRPLHEKDEEPLKNFLRLYREQSMFIRNNFYRSGLLYQNMPFHGNYIGAVDDQECIHGILVHYWNGNLMTQTSSQNILKNLIASGKNYFKRPIAGFIGMDDHVMEIIKNFHLTHHPYHINRREILYSLNLNTLKLWTLPPDMHIVPAKEVDISILINWMYLYDKEALGADDSASTFKKAQEKASQLQKEDCWVLVCKNMPVALCAFNARVENSVQIGPVWTPKDSRNKGYARILINNTLYHAYKNGVKSAILFTDNSAAIKIYESIGFQKIGYYRLAFLKEPILLQNILP